MRRIILPGTKLAVSRFAFGTASLHHVGGLKAQTDHLRAAADVGFLHFDTAPLYGFGASENALGEAFGRGKGIHVSVATKVGLYPPGGAVQMRAAVLARKGLGRIFPTLSRPHVDWTVANARRSLDDSLRRLQRDHIELLLLHEPEIESLDAESWLKWIEHEVVAGRIGTFGIAGQSSKLHQFIAANSPFGAFIQTQDSATRREADFMAPYGRAPQITYGYLSAIDNAKVNSDVLATALARNRDGAILVSTRSKPRLASFAIAADAEQKLLSASRC